MRIKVARWFFWHTAVVYVHRVFDDRFTSRKLYSTKRTIYYESVLFRERAWPSHRWYIHLDYLAKFTSMRTPRDSGRCLRSVAVHGPSVGELCSRQGAGSHAVHFDGQRHRDSQDASALVLCSPFISSSRLHKGVGVTCYWCISGFKGQTSRFCDQLTLFKRTGWSQWSMRN